MKNTYIFFTRTSLCLFFSIFFSFKNYSNTDILETIGLNIRTANTAEISKYFDNRIQLEILDKTGSYTKSEAQDILSEFLKKHPVRNFSIIHKGKSGKDAQFAIGKYETSNKSFRVYLFLKPTGQDLLLRELKFTEE
jgi:Na+-transporting NADH:ubiquinone oxidoreductase subunit NqrC